VSCAVAAMNYRHAFHAGNFADVHKHAVLGRVLAHLRLKPAPFRVIDTHAGAGRYDLSRPEPARTGEWRHRIARVWEASLPAEPQPRSLSRRRLGVQPQPDAWRLSGLATD
jgi:23S rRNA A2030 N6-methylase RlmJ